MPKLSLRQASQQFSVSRQTLGKALENGVISGTKNAKGNWLLDSAELIRVYEARPQIGRTIAKDFTTPAMPKDGAVHALAIAESALEAEREKNAMLQRHLDDVQRHLDDVRRLLPPIDAKPRARWWPW